MKIQRLRPAPHRRVGSPPAGGRRSRVGACLHANRHRVGLAASGAPAARSRAGSLLQGGGASISGGKPPGRHSTAPHRREGSPPAGAVAGWARGARGFTLLELLIAVAVFAVISAVAYGGLQAVLNTDSQTRLRGGILADLQVTLAVLERDLRQVAPVERRDRFGDRQPALRYSPLATEPELELVRAGSGGVDRLRRVGWRVTEEGLERRLWEVVDAGDEREPIARVFLAAGETADGPEPVQMELRFLVPGPRGGEVLDSWPPLRPTDPPRDLPALVEIILEVPGLGRVERHLALPGGA